MDATQPKDLEKLQAQMEQAKKVIPLETLLVTKTVKFWVPPEIALFHGLKQIHRDAYWSNI